MRTKNIFLVLAACLLAFAATSQAAWIVDADAVAPCTGHNIAQAKVDVWPSVKVPTAGGGTEQWYDGKIGIQMASGSTVGGSVVVEIDADNNIATGGSYGMGGMAGFKSCHDNANNVYPATPGIDVAINIPLRTQAETAQSAMTIGAYRCVQPMSPNPCIPAGCGAEGLPCTPGSLAAGLCYSMGIACTQGECVPPGATTECNRMDDCNLCDAAKLRARHGGSWFAMDSTGMQNNAPTVEGEVVNPPLVNATSACITVPLSKAIQYTSSAQDPANPKAMDRVAALNPANWKMIVSVWTASEDDDDSIRYDDTLGKYCTSICDAVEGVTVAVLTAPYCVSDIAKGDNKVDSFDLLKMKGEFGVTGCPCK